MTRCEWCGDDPLYLAYHDREWGVPVHDDRKLFEMLILEGAQAGLSWITILRKRPEYLKAFDNFQPEAVAAYGPADARRLLGNPGIIRNRLKIAAAIDNARAFLAVLRSHGTFDGFIWSFVGGSQKQNRFKRLIDLPARTAESDAMSRELRRRGFRFVGPTICYSFMQAVGMVNDHVVGCFRYREIAHKNRTANGEA